MISQCESNEAVAREFLKEDEAAGWFEISWRILCWLLEINPLPLL